MKVKRVSVSGFRSFVSPVEFDLDASVVVLSGPNGTGKTSLVDAIMWGLFGRIPRLAKRQEAVISTYSDDGTARVELHVDWPDEGQFIIQRGFDGERTTISVRNDDRAWTKQAAEEKLLDLLCSPKSASDAVERFTRSAYLQQDVVRQFLDGSDEERFEAVADLVGSGRTVELQKALESGRNAWSRATTQRAKELESAENEFSDLLEQISRLPDSPPQSDLIQDKWKKWVSHCTKLLDREVNVNGEVPGGREAIIEELGKDLRSERKSLDQDIRSVVECIQGIGEIDEQATRNIEEFQKEREKKKAALTALQTEYDDLREIARTERSKIRELQDENDQLAAMAKLALDHLNEVCPVCEQEIDPDQVRERLQTLINKSSERLSIVEPPELNTKRDEIEKLSSEIDKIEKDLQQAKMTENRNESWRGIIAAQIKALGLNIEGEPTDQDLLKQLIAEQDILTERRHIFLDLVEDGQELSADVARLAEYSRRKELESALEEAKIKRERLLIEHSRYEKTYDEATRVIDAIRSAAIEIQAAKIEQIQPILNRIYHRIDPHPAFTSVQLMTSPYRGKGRTKVLVRDAQTKLIDSQEPTAIFSSSQLNALAVAVFLAFNLGDKDYPIQTAILDDPLQSLDDVNLLGLVDVLRRMKKKRQLIITTHDHRFARLLSRKLRPVRDDERLVAVEFTSWGRDGPEHEFSTETGKPGSYSVLKSVA